VEGAGAEEDCKRERERENSVDFHGGLESRKRKNCAR
jgi:hypothetical protein